MREPRRLRLVATAVLLAVALIAAPSLGQGGWTLPGLEGGRLAESDVTSGATIIVVWAGWSPRSKDIVPRVNQIVSEWSSKAKVVTVNFQEEPPEVREFLEGKGLRAPVFLDLDGSFAKRHRVTTLPGLLIYRGGDVAHRGQLPQDPSDVIASVLDR